MVVAWWLGSDRKVAARQIVAHAEPRAPVPSAEEGSASGPDSLDLELNHTEECYDTLHFTATANPLKRPMKHSGKFITFEGLDGCGKSTQLERETSRLRQQGLPVVTTQEPGGTVTGQRIREIVLHATSLRLSASTELALMFAARSQHIEEVILPALHAGKIVLCDRFTDSSVAYQGYGRGISPDAIRSLEDLFCRGLRPDLTIILDIDPETGRNRARARNRAAQEKDTRFEKEGLEFFRRVRKGYEEIARLEPKRVRIIDGKGSMEDVHKQVCKVVNAFLQTGGSGGAGGV